MVKKRKSNVVTQPSDTHRWQSLMRPDTYITDRMYVVEAFFFYSHNFKDDSYKSSGLYGPHIFKATAKMLKKYDAEVIVSAIIESKIESLSNYGLMQWYLNKEQAEYDRRNSAKDTRKVEYTKEEVQDLRTNDDIVQRKKYGLDLLED